MKKIAIAIILFTIGGNLKAQDHTQSLQGISKVKITSDPNIIIKAHDKNEILIKSNGRKAPEKAKGLKAVYSGGSDNTGLGVYVAKEGDVLIVRNLRGMHGPKLEIYVSKNADIHAENTKIGNVYISGFSSEIEVKTNVGSIDIEEVGGPIVAKSSTGGINVNFGKVNQASPISITSSTGDVDVSLPANTPANLKLKSSMGEIYTDFELKLAVDDKNMKVVGGRKSISTMINNGGVDISLRSSVGNIYLRKK